MRRTAIPGLRHAAGGLSWRRRAALGAVVLLLLAAGGWLAALVAGPADDRGGRGGPAPGAGSPASPAPDRQPSAEEEAAWDGVLRRPPSTSDPVAFARAAAQVLWSYDARRTTHAGRTAELRAWMTGEEQYADWDSVAAVIPSPGAWEGLAANAQYATAQADDARFPQAFTRALQEDPGAIRLAHVYAVTVTGEQAIRWRGGGRGAEARAVTLAVQCRPQQACALAGQLPRVAP